MVSQERAVGQGISALSAVSAPPRSPEAPPAPVPVLPRPKTEPVPTVFPEPQPRTTKKSLFRRMANNLALRIFLATGAIAGTAGYAAYEKIPAAHQTVEQALARFRLIEVEAVVPPIFDSKAISTVIEAGVNTVRATNEDLARIQDNIIPPPSPTEENGLPALPQFTFLTPFLLNDGDQISMSRRYIGPGIETATGKIVEPRYAGRVKFTVPSKGTEIIPGIVDPKAISMEVFKKPFLTINGEEYFGGVTILVTRQDGTQYGVGFSSPEDVRSLVPLPILDDAPTFKNTKDMLSKKGLSITGTTPIMKTGIDNALVDFGGSRISPSRSVNDLFFSEIQLFQSNGKALLPPQP